MDGRSPRGILYVGTGVEPPENAAEFEDWYHNVRFPDVTEPGILVNPVFFHNARVPPQGGEGRFLA